MSQTRHHQPLINALDQNASQPIYRLSPELIGEIFLLGRPEILLQGGGLPWDKLVRYLVGITSITSHFRRIALDFGELWSMVGFSLRTKDVDCCSVVLVIVEAFLERSRGCNLHFRMADEVSGLTWFYSRLVTLIKPHAGRVQTFYFLHNGDDLEAWEELCVLVNDTVNLKKLTLHIFTYMTPMPPLRLNNTLRKLTELRLSGFVYDPSLQEIMKQVEILGLSREIEDLHQWLESAIKLKRLVLPTDQYETDELINPISSVRLGDLTHLHIDFKLYQWIAPWLSLPNLRHLDVFMGLLKPPLSHFEPKGHHLPLLRTLRIALDSMHTYALDHVALIIMNPQLEYLEIDWNWCRSGFSLSELSNRRFAAPSGALPTFPGSCLKYLRMAANANGPDLAPESRFLSSILSKDSQLKLELFCWRSDVTCKELMEQFPTQVKCYGHRDSIPLHELYERAQRE